MDLHQIDYISVSRQSWLHRLPAFVKLMVLVTVIVMLLRIESIWFMVGVLLFMIAMALVARIPIKVYLPLFLYPVVFLAIISLSIEDFSLNAVGLLVLRVLSVTSSVVLFFLTTSYPVIFGMLSRILPAFLVAALFFSYRSIFVIADSIEDTRTALRLRGGSSWRHPIATLRYFGTALGHIFVHAIDMSQRIADGLAVRGFANKIYYLGDRK
jgi:energy-coupling factor transporter transmembrane protein EcfT